jgi:hypothetical protein
MDVFVSVGSDTFGNVIQKRTLRRSGNRHRSGGPKFIVRHDETGFIAENFDDFVKFSLLLMKDAERLAKMKSAAREFARSRSWDAVFESVYRAYGEARAIAQAEKAIK